MTSASQTSAPVHEYRCLFTHDLHKKQKKWHDGTLKFHTYNSRVMVYDDRQNFVGDLHYRGSEVFGEGVDIQLDKPVLVNVEDRLGESNTDLTEVLRQRNDPGPPQSFRTGLPRTPASTTQPKQRSIKDLLAASQSHLGRGGLPSRSPFEQRQQQIQSTSIEPPTKRQKVQDDKERLPPPQSKQKTTALVPAIRASKQQTGTTSDPSNYAEKSFRNRHVHLVTHGRQAKSLSSVQPPQRKSAVDLTLQPRVKVSVHDKAESQRGDPEPNRPPLPVPTAGHITRLPDISDQQNHKPRSPLTFAPHRPLPRLRYKALLPGGSRSPDVHENGCEADKPNFHSETERLRPARSAHLLELDRLMGSEANTQIRLVLPANPRNHPQQYEKVAAKTPLTDGNALHCGASTMSHDIVDVPEPERIHIDSSPLFVPYTQTQSSIPPTQLSVKADFEIPGAEQNQTPIVEQPLSMNETLQDRAAEVTAPERGRLNRPFATDEDDDDNDDDNDDDSIENGNDDNDDSSVESRPQTKGNAYNRVESRDSNVSDTSSERSDTGSPTREVYVPPELLSDAESRRSSRANSDIGDVDMEDQSLQKDALPPDPASPSATTCARTFRRVLSESNVDDRALSKRTKAASPQKTAMLPPSTFLRSGALDTASVAVVPTALQRSASDSVVLEELEVSSTAIDAFLAEATPFQANKRFSESDPRASQENHNANVEDEISEQLEEQGPWTSSEAFLLFDWWPPSHVKPDYGQPRQGPQTTRTTMSKSTKVKIANAATARSAEASVGLGKMGKYGNFRSARLVSQR